MTSSKRKKYNFNNVEHAKRGYILNKNTNIIVQYSQAGKEVKGLRRRPPFAGPSQWRPASGGKLPTVAFSYGVFVKKDAFRRPFWLFLAGA
jgi:hypothetical protein